jgi:outer membrane protein assembly factor BamB
MLWEQKLAGYTASMVALDDDGNLYIGTDGSDFGGDSLWSLSRDGKVRWSTGRGTFIAVTVGRRGTVYFRDHVSNLHALDANGTELWTFAGSGVRTPGELTLVETDTDIVFVTSSLGLSAIDRNWKWTFDPPNDVRVPPSAIADTEGNVYVAFGQTVYSLGHDGHERWQVSVPAPVRRLVLGGPGLLYAIAAGQALYAITDSSQSPLGGIPVADSGEHGAVTGPEARPGPRAAMTQPQ